MNMFKQISPSFLTTICKATDMYVPCYFCNYTSRSQNLRNIEDKITPHLATKQENKLGLSCAKLSTASASYPLANSLS